MLQGVLVRRCSGRDRSSSASPSASPPAHDGAELADEAGSPELPLYRLLRSATGLGSSPELPDGRFGLGPLGAAVGEYEPMPWVYECFGQFSRAIATGKTGMQLAHGADLFEFLARPPATRCRVRQAMRLIHADEPSGRRRAYDFGGAPTVVDVGGGNGDLLSALLDRPSRTSRCALRPSSRSSRAAHRGSSTSQGAGMRSAGTSSTASRPAGTPTCCRTSSTTGREDRRCAFSATAARRWAPTAGCSRRDGGPGR